MLTLKLILKNIQKNPLTYLINFFGLILSMVIVILLGVYCFSELSSDKHHQNGDRVYLIANQWDADHMGINTPGIMKNVLDTDVPEIEASVRIAGTWDIPVFQVKDNPPIQSSLLYVDLDFFRLFSYEFVEGDAQTALAHPMGLVLLETEAHKLFGKKPALGNTVKLDNEHQLTVTAVIKPMGTNTFLTFSALAPISVRKIVYGSDEFNNWNWSNFKTFALLQPNSSVENASKTITNLVNLHTGVNEIALLPLPSLYFSSLKYSWDIFMIQGNKNQTFILLLVAILVLITALVNYINISGAHRLETLKRTGIQKIIGADRRHIFRHIIIESLVIFMCASCFAIWGAATLYPVIQNYTGVHFTHNLLFDRLYITIFLMTAALLGTVASIIPAIRFAASHPIQNLKNILVPDERKSRLRSVFVVSQFALAITLISFTLLVQKQVNFATSKTGYNKENIIGIKITSQLHEKREILKQQLSVNPYVQQISFTQFFPGKPISGWGLELPLKDGTKQTNFRIFDADAEFTNMMGLEIAAGRFFTNNETDKNTALVNEQFIKTHGIDEIIGVTFDDHYGGTTEIIGIVKDFHFNPVNQPIGPLMIRHGDLASYCLVKTDADNFNMMHQFLQDIKKTSQKLSPAFPVDIQFIDKATENMYQNELQFRRLFSIFAGCAILICCLGILALSIFASQKRIKEIGIRKVNGAQPWEIVALLNKDFIKWVAIAFVLAAPISWFAMNKWLQNFAYKTDVTLWLFLISGSAALVIALLTVSFQTIKAAKANPINSIRYE